MAYRAKLIEGVYFLRWGTPTKQDYEHLEVHVREEVRRFGRKVPTVIVISADADPPPPDVVMFAIKRWATLTANLTVMHVVVEGTGFRASLQRAVLTSMRQLLRSDRVGKTYVSAESAAREVGPVVGIDAARFVQIIRDEIPLAVPVR